MIKPPNEALAAKYLIKTHYIMKVIEFHPDTQTVDLQQDVAEFSYSPMSERMMTNEFGINVAVVPCLPDILENVPVKQFRFGQFEIQACPAPGDTGYIEVFTNDIRDWIENGGLSIPWSDEHFMKQSCVFVPFVPNMTSAVKDYPANEDGSADLTKMVIKSRNTKITITDKLPENETDENKETSVSVTTPSSSITLTDKTPVSGDPTTELNATVQTVNITAKKGFNVTGDLNVEGNISATKDINAGGNVSAKGDVTAANGTISLKSHTHNFNYVGAGTGSSPQQGTTLEPQ